MDETKSPENDGEDKGADGQHEVAHHLGQLHLHDVIRLCLLFLPLFFPRLEIQDSCFRHDFSFILEHLMGGVKHHLKKGDGHGEEQPYVDHLYVRSNRKALGKAEEAKMRIVVSSWC